MIGHPIGHSLSPTIHNAAFKATGLDWVFVALDVQPGSAAAVLDAVRSSDIAGLSVTMPHKADTAATVDVLSDGAEALGAVNCVENDAGRLVGHNTDGDGFIAGLEAQQIDVEGSACLLLGGGGAAAAVAEALGRHGAGRVGVVNRTAARAARVAELAGSVGEVTGIEETPRFDMIVNATSVGMAGTDSAGMLPLDSELLGTSHVVVDLVYNPIDTPLLKAARSAGARTVDGLGMLVGQAARAFQIWTGHAAPVDEMAAAARSALASLGE